MRQYLIEILGIVANGQLFLSWNYTENVYQHATVEHLAQNYMDALRTLINHCTSGETGGYTPSDFPEAQLSQNDLDQFLAKIKF
jgi:non-ribosomal peptide synthase protein (TIGR01720 family)